MTERLHRLELQAFRGVPGELVVDFGQGQSLAVFGENGTGKSTIADALEWFFTGEVELLAHEGRQHAVRHLGSDPERPTSVVLETSGSLGGRAVFPDESETGARGIAGRETFLLRGRTLADFINKTKSEKWKALSEILGLDAVDELRQDLQRVRTELRKRAKTVEQELETCQKALSPAGEEPSEAGILSGLQQICNGLKITPPDSLARVADPSWQAAFVSSAGRQGQPSPPSLLGAEVASLRPPELERAAWSAFADAVSSVEATLQPSRLRLYEAAGSILDPSTSESTCPLCGQEVDGESLGERISAALLELRAAAAKIEAVRGALEQQLDSLTAAAERRESLRLQAGLLKLELPPVPPSPCRELRAALEQGAAVDFESAARWRDELVRWDDAARRAVEQTNEQTNAQTETGSVAASQNQLLMLVTLCQQIQRWQETKRQAAAAARARDLADRVYAAYEQRQQDYLAEILARINSRVAEIYDRLHPGEGLGEVCVEPWTAKGIELAINFHGKRQRPPHGVLSESHLNSLAIALFIAMAETFNEQLGFLVLDDVINSFDINHRGSLAGLLAEKTDWQLVVLTHDYQFYDLVTRRAPSWKKLELTSWSYTEGPRTSRYRSGDLVAEARASLAGQDVQGAAAKARRSLEEQLQEVCEALEALLPFRRGADNDRRELGELFKGLRRTLKEHAKTLLKELEPLLQALEADVGAILNLEVHASPGRAAAGEVQAALERIVELDRYWSCPSCETRLWWKGTPESGRCRCGQGQFPPAPRS